MGSQTHWIARARRYRAFEAIEVGASVSSRRWYSGRMLGNKRATFDAIWAKVDLIPGWFDRANAAAMFSVIAAAEPRRVVEIGSYLGRSTIFFALALDALGLARPGAITAIDPHTGDRSQLEALGTDSIPTFDLFRHHCRAAGVDDIVRPVRDTSVAAASSWSEPIDLLYIDGWHSYDAVIADAHAWLPHVGRDSVVVFDDYAAHDEVRRAVDHLAQSGVIHYWGNVFGQAYAGAAPPPASVAKILGIVTAPVPSRLFAPRPSR